MAIRVNHVINVFYFIVLYIFIYSPQLQFLNFGVGKLLWFFTFIYFIYNRKKITLLNLFKNELLIFSILIVYTLFITIWGGINSLKFAYLHLQFVLDCIVVPIFIYCFFNNNVDIRKISNHIINVGLIASFITIFLIINSDFNFYLRDHVIIDDLDGGTVQESLRKIRGFSFADSSTFGYGITQGLIIGLALFESKFSKKYIFYLIPLLISILFNARVGFFVVIISFLFFVSRFLSLKTVIISSLLFIIAFLLLYNSNISHSNSSTIEWGSSFVNETIDFFSGKKVESSTYTALINKLNVFPEDTFNFLFGEGHYIIGKGSDVGYINQIFVGGIFYLIFLLLIMFFLFYNFNSLTESTSLTLFFFISIIIVNIKGPAFLTSISFWRVIMLIYVFSKLNNIKYLDYHINYKRYL